MCQPGVCSWNCPSNPSGVFLFSSGLAKFYPRRAQTSTSRRFKRALCCPWEFHPHPDASFRFSMLGMGDLCCLNFDSTSWTQKDCWSAWVLLTHALAWSLLPPGHRRQGVSLKWPHSAAAAPHTGCPVSRRVVSYLCLLPYLHPVRGPFAQQFMLF